MNKTRIFLCITLIQCLCVFSKNKINLGFNSIEIDSTKQVMATIKTLSEVQQNAYQQKDYEVFKKYTDSILDIAIKAQLKELEVESLVWQSLYYKKVDKNKTNQKAEEDNYQRAMDLAQKLEDPEQKIASLIQMGNIYYNAPLSYRTDDPFGAAWKLLKHAEIPAKYEMAIYFGRGSYYSQRANFSVAISNLERAKEIAIATQNSYITIASLAIMTDISNALNQPEVALKHIEEALDRCKHQQSAKLWAMSIFLKSNALMKQGQFSAAIKLLELVLEIATSNAYPYLENHTHKLLSDSYTELSNFKKSDEHLKKHIPMDTRIHFFPFKTGLDTITNGTTEKMKSKDIEKKYSEINTLINRKTSEKANSNTIVFIGIGLIIIALLVFFSLKKKKENEELKKIREDYITLANDHIDFKTRMYQLANKIQKEQEDSTTKKQPKYDNSSLSKEDKDQYMNHILEFMEKEKPHLDFEVNQSNLANKLNIQSHHFSEVLSFCFKQNFNNFINNYRVNEAKKIMQDPKYDNYKILAIGYEAGFKSKTSFNRVFKTHVGLTPSEYKKQYVLSTTIN